MVAKKAEESPKAASTEAQTQSQNPASQGSADAKKRPWIRKTPVEIILEQVSKQDEKVKALRKELAKEETELQKMKKATELLGGS